jgi:hypothetical protein
MRVSQPNRKAGNTVLVAFREKEPSLMTLGTPVTDAIRGIEVGNGKRRITGRWK